MAIVTRNFWFTAILAFAIALLPQAYAGLVVQNGAMNSSSNFYVGAGALFVNATSGYVGVGATSPQRPLHITAAQDADLRLQDTSGAGPAAYIEFYNDTTRWGYIGLAGHDDKLTIATAIDKNLSFYTNNQPRMTVTAAGNVGIGTTGPTQTLDVNGTVNAYAFTVNGSAFTGGNGSSQWTTSGSNIYYGTGNVGIGTSSPSVPLMVRGSLGEEYAAKIYNSNATGTYAGGLRVYTDGTASSNAVLYAVGGSGPGFIVTGQNNVGIGTSVPTQRLDVYGNVAATEFYRQGVALVPGSVNGNYWTQSGTSAYYTQGNVGIGATAPGAKLDVYGNLRVGNNNADASGYDSILWNLGDTVSGFRQVIDTANTYFGIEREYYGWQTTPVFAIQRNTGNVGIGTTSPNTTLDTVGYIRAKDVYPSNPYPTGGNGLEMVAYNGISYFQSINRSSGNYLPLVIYGNSTSIMQGNVGIGTTDPRFYYTSTDSLGINQLFNSVGGGPHVLALGTAQAYSASSRGANIYFTGLDSSGHQRRFATVASVFGTSAENGSLAFFTKGTGDGDIVERVRISDTGNVGIGTTSPSATLHVNGNAVNGVLRVSDSGSHGSIDIGVDANQPWFGTSTANDLRVISSGTERLRLTSAGNVGIGTASPLSLLNAYSSGNARLTLSHGGGTGNGGSIDFDHTGESQKVQARISGYDDGANAATLKFWTKDASTSEANLTERMTILQNGNVGIGTSSPSIGQLQVESASSVPAAFLRPAMTAGQISEVYVGKTNSGYQSLAMGYVDSATASSRYAFLRLWGFGDANSLILSGNGNVGIGTTTPGYTLTVAGTAWVTSGSWSGSDARWKKNVTALSPSGSLEKVLALKPVNFEWRASEFPNMGFTNGTQVGFIAQDVEKVIPEVVTTDNNGYKGLSYEKMVPVVAGAVQEQQKLIEDQQAQIDALKAVVCADHPQAEACR